VDKPEREGNHGVRPERESTTRVPLATVPAGTLALWVGPFPLKVPGPCRAPFPPLALGGAGGHALRAKKLGRFNKSSILQRM
jgi:hypothetical protein